MANAFVYEVVHAFPYDDLSFHGQSFSSMDKSMAILVMTCHDPNLQNISPTPYGNPWDQSVQQFPGDNQKPSFAPSPCGQLTNRTHLRPTVGIQVVPSPSQARFASPISSIDPGSAGCGLSPPAVTDSHPDNFPQTPPDTTLRSPFQTPLPLEQYSHAHAVQSAGTGLDFVNPLDVSSGQPSDYCGSDSGIVDFDMIQQGYGFDNQVLQDSNGPSVNVLGMASPEGMQSTMEDEIEALSQYPPLPQGGGKVMESEETTPHRLKRHTRNDDDSDYQSRKKPKQSPRTSGGRGPKTDIRPISSARPTRRRRGRGTERRCTFSCPECGQSDFTYQSELDAHIKKQHRRLFYCVFDFAGCDSTFASKNEWKRHVSSQHLLLNYWVCTECNCAKASAPPSDHPSTDAPTDPKQPTGTIFNRKDLFTEHLKRMHTPPEIKALPPSFTFSPSSTPNNNKKRKTGPTTSSSPGKDLPPGTARALADWEARVRQLQQSCVRPRCALPTYMRCPARACGAVFRGADAWNQRMEHVAKHLERHAAACASAGGGEKDGVGREKEGEKEKERVVFGGDGDETLVRWAARPDVAIIAPAPATATATAQGGDEGVAGGRWVLNDMLKRGPGGNVVVLAPVSTSLSPPGGEKEGAGAGEEEPRDEEESDVVEGEIVVGSPLDQVEDDLLDAEGEEDD